MNEDFAPAHALPTLIIDDAVRRALAEDLGRAGDITTLAIIPDSSSATATTPLPTAKITLPAATAVMVAFCSETAAMALRVVKAAMVAFCSETAATAVRAATR